MDEYNREQQKNDDVVITMDEGIVEQIQQCRRPQQQEEASTASVAASSKKVALSGQQRQLQQRQQLHDLKQPPTTSSARSKSDDYDDSDNSDNSSDHRDALLTALQDEVSIRSYLSKHPNLYSVRVCEDEVWTLLQYAVSHGVPAPVVRFLLERDPAAVRAQNYEKETALQTVCQRGNNRDPAVIELLTQRYPEAVAVAGFAGWNPLHEVLREGEIMLESEEQCEPPAVETMDHLLRLWPAPAACLQRDEDGEIPLDHCVAGYYFADQSSGGTIQPWPDRDGRVRAVREKVQRSTWNALRGLIDACLSSSTASGSAGTSTATMPPAVTSHVKACLAKCSPPYQGGSSLSSSLGQQQQRQKKNVRFSSAALELFLDNRSVQEMLQEEPYQRTIHHYVQQRGRDQQANSADAAAAALGGGAVDPSNVGSEDCMIVVIDSPSKKRSRMASQREAMEEDHRQDMVLSVPTTATSGAPFAQEREESSSSSSFLLRREFTQQDHVRCA